MIKYTVLLLSISNSYKSKSPFANNCFISLEQICCQEFRKKYIKELESYIPIKNGKNVILLLFITMFKKMEYQLINSNNYGIDRN